MTVGELSRQYQAVLEAERRTRTELEGVVSSEDELAHAADELAAAREALEHAWASAQLAHLPITA